MRLFCWYCHESVSSELPAEAIFRAVAVCPECIEKSDEAAQLRLALDPPSALVCTCAASRVLHEKGCPAGNTAGK